MNITRYKVPVFQILKQLQFNFIGSLSYGDIFAILNLNLRNIELTIKIFKGLKTVYLCIILYLVSQILSDFKNNSNPSDFLRGWATPIMSLVLISFYLISFNEYKKGIVLYLLFSSFAQFIFKNNSIDYDYLLLDTNYFKSKIQPIINPLIIYLSYFFYNKEKYFIVYLILISYIITCFFQDARSESMIFIISTILIFTRTRLIGLKKLKLLSYFIVLFLFFYFIYICYIYLVLNYNFGGINSQTQVKIADNPYNIFDLLIYGRPELLPLIQAIKDAPFWGHGSWSPDPEGKYNLFNFTTNLTARTGEDTGFLIAHSVFFGSWAWSGILGFCSLFYLFFHLFKISFNVYKKTYDFELMPILIPITVDMMWAYFFSPLGLLRTTFPFFVALVLILNNRVQK